MTNGPKSASLYTGITGNLPRRVWQHKNKLMEGFTSRYNLTQLVHYERFIYPDAAISEKEIEGWRRSNKIKLIEAMDSRWENLAKDWQNVYKPESTRIVGRSLAPLERTRGFGMTLLAWLIIQTKRRLSR